MSASACTRSVPGFERDKYCKLPFNSIQFFRGYVNGPLWTSHSQAFSDIHSFVLCLRLHNANKHDDLRA